MKAIERRALQSEAMGLCPWSGLQTECLERTPEKRAGVEPSTKHGIEPVRVCAALFQAHLSIDGVVVSLLSVNNVHYVDKEVLL